MLFGVYGKTRKKENKKKKRIKKGLDKGSFLCYNGVWFNKRKGKKEMKKEVEIIEEKRTLIFCGSVFKMPDITDKEWGLIKVMADYINLQNEDLQGLRQKIHDIKTALYDD